MGLAQEIDRFADGADVLKVGLHEVRSLLELSDKVSTVVLRKMARSSKLRSKNGQRRHHVGEGLGGGHRLFWTGVDVDALTAEASDGGAHHVHHTEHLPAFELDFLDGRNRIGGFTGLRNSEVNRFWIDDGVVVPEFAGNVGHRRKAPHFFNEHLTDFGCISRRTATEQAHVRGLDKGGVVETHPTQTAGAHLPVDASGDALPKSIGLFVDLLVHVVGRITEFRFAPCVLQDGNVWLDIVAFGRRDAESVALNNGHVAVLEVNNSLRVGRQWVRVA